jgi:hypothetical protein
MTTHKPSDEALSRLTSALADCLPNEPDAVQRIVLEVLKVAEIVARSRQQSPTPTAMVVNPDGSETPLL